MSKSVAEIFRRNFEYKIVQWRSVCMLKSKIEKLSIKNVTKRYKSLTVVDNVSFEVRRGQPMAILGRNGAGKSTIIKMVLGLISPTSGKIEVPAGCKVGYLPEERGIYQDVTVEEHLILFAKLAGVKNVSQAVDKWLYVFEISRYRKFPLKSLSKGNAQRVQFAIALINEPDLLILDEPLSGLDPVSAQVFQNIILEESKNRILITTSHNMNYVEKLCEQVTLLDSGHQVVCGEISDIKKLYGKRKLEIPYENNLEEILREYNPVINGERLIIEGVKGIEEYKGIIEKIKNTKEVDFINYRYSDMEEIFIELLGKKNG